MTIASKVGVGGASAASPGRVGGAGNHSYGPFFIEYALLAE